MKAKMHIARSIGYGLLSLCLLSLWALDVQAQDIGSGSGSRHRHAVTRGVEATVLY